MNRYWAFNAQTNAYAPAEVEPLSVFPTIVDAKRMAVFCRKHRRWERVAAFSRNVLTAGCGKRYAGPFTADNTTFTYGYDITRRRNSYHIIVRSQLVATDRRRLVESRFELDTAHKKLYRDNRAVFEPEDIGGMLCKEAAAQILDELGERYRAAYGIKPGVASQLSGLSVILGYLLCPFNVNFYRIARHWGLNPYDKDFSSLSSGDTPTAENEMFASLGIRATKAIRKLYQKTPWSVVCYAAAKDLGFTDVNILRRSVTAEFYKFLSDSLISFGGGDITYTVRDSLLRFAADLLALCDQRTVWNSIERTARFHAHADADAHAHAHIQSVVTDGIQMYGGLADFLTDREKKDIMREGFNQYTHDFLLRRNTALCDERVAAHNAEREIQRAERAAEEARLDLEPFPIESRFLELEYKSGKAFYTDKTTGERRPVPDEDRWCFYVAHDGRTLKTIGSEMHNCVGWGYRDAVRRRRATIVYAMHKGKYKICIEVTPSFSVRQAFGPGNSELAGEAFEAYSEWCREKRIVRRKAFSIHGAP